MDEASVPDAAPPLSQIEDVFTVYEIAVDDDEIRYFGTPLVPIRELVRELWPTFREHGYELQIRRELGEWILVGEPIQLGIDEIPWTNIILAVATIASTLFAGTFWYHLDPTSPEIIHAWPFALSIMFVLGVHELGHYVMSRHHRVQASLPYFIPLPTLIGTMGAVIKMDGQIPSRRALFDIGVAGPLAGLAATIVVTVIGLHLPPVTAPDELVADPDAVLISLGYPLLLEGLAFLVDQPLSFEEEGTFVNPVVIAGWVGMFVTFLNLIPVGQLDGGHITRAIVGDRAQLVAALVPMTLFGLAGVLYFVLGVGAQSIVIWGVWGVLTLVFVAVGPAHPIDDRPLGNSRVVIGILTFVFGLLCFTPVPIEIHA